MPSCGLARVCAVPLPCPLLSQCHHSSAIVCCQCFPSETCETVHRKAIPYIPYIRGSIRTWTMRRRSSTRILGVTSTRKGPRCAAPPHPLSPHTPRPHAARRGEALSSDIVSRLANMSLLHTVMGSLHQAEAAPPALPAGPPAHCHCNLPGAQASRSCNHNPRVTTSSVLLSPACRNGSPKYL